MANVIAATAPVELLNEDRYKNRYIIAAAVSLAAMLQVVDSSIVNVAIPTMMGTLGVSLDEISLVSTTYIIASVIIIPMTGWLANVFGRKRYFAGSILLFTAASFLCGTARSLEALVLWRIVQGIGGGALMATSQAILYSSFPREETGTAMAFFGLGIMVGPTLGPTLGGWITDNYSWPWIFYVNVPLGILAALMVVAYVHDDESDGRSTRIDTLGILFLVLSVGALQFVLERGEHYDWFDSGLILSLLILGVLGTVMLVWRELTTANPVIEFRILKNLQYTAGTLFGIVVGAGLMGSVFVLPVFLQQILGMSALQTGMIILPGALATAGAMLVVGRLSARFDNRVLILIGSLLFGASMWDLSKLTAMSGAGDLFVPLILRGFGLGLVFVPMTNLTLAQVKISDLGQATGLNNFFRQMGGSFSIAMMANLLVHFTAEKKSALAGHLSYFDPATRARLGSITNAMMSRGTDATTAQQQALRIMDGMVARQAAVLSFEKVFLISGAILVLALPLLLLFPTGHPTRRAPGGAAHAE